VGYDPNMAQQMVQTVEPEEFLTWAQIAYYAGGALVALCIAVIKGRTILRWGRKKWQRSKE
jgi:hypothetical protein